MNEVALLGGGFNPVGLHHQKIAQTIWREVKIPTWFMPCYSHRFAKHSELALSSHRWNMVTEVTGDNKYMRSCDWEMAHEHNGAMYETLQGLAKAHPNTRFNIVIGMDNANVMTTDVDGEPGWARGEYLIKENSFLVLQRTGVETQVDWFLEEPHRLLTFDCPTSSSEIRQAIAAGDYAFAQQHLHRRVWEYIIAGSLYGYTKDRDHG